MSHKNQPNQPQFGAEKPRSEKLRPLSAIGKAVVYDRQWRILNATFTNFDSTFARNYPEFFAPSATPAALATETAASQTAPEYDFARAEREFAVPDRSALAEPPMAEPSTQAAMSANEQYIDALARDSAAEAPTDVMVDGRYDFALGEQEFSAMAAPSAPATMNTPGYDTQVGVYKNDGPAFQAVEQATFSQPTNTAPEQRYQDALQVEQARQGVIDAFSGFGRGGE